MPEESNLRDALRKFWREMMDGVHTFFPGKIVRVKSSMLVDVEPTVKVRFFGEKEDTQIPIIPNVVLINFRDEGSIVRSPKESLKGARVGIFCAEHSLNEWRSSKGKSLLPIEGRRFNINDAIAILGLYPETLPWSVEQKPNTFEIQVKQGYKIGIGDTSGNEIVDIIHQIVEILLQPDSGSDTLTGVSTKGKNLDQIKAILANLGNVT